MLYILSVIIHAVNHKFYEHFVLSFSNSFIISWGNFKTSKAAFQRLKLEKSVQKIYSKFTGEHPWQSVIAIKLFATLLKSHFDMEITFRHSKLLTIFAKSSILNVWKGSEHATVTQPREKWTKMLVEKLRNSITKICILK